MRPRFFLIIRKNMTIFQYQSKDVKKKRKKKKKMKKRMEKKKKNKKAKEKKKKKRNNKIDKDEGKMRLKKSEKRK